MSTTNEGDGGNVESPAPPLIGSAQGGWEWAERPDLRSSYTRTRTIYYIAGSVSIVAWIGLVGFMLINKTLTGQAEISLIGSVTAVIFGGLFSLGRALPLNATQVRYSLLPWSLR